MLGSVFGDINMTWLKNATEEQPSFESLDLRSLWYHVTHGTMNYQYLLGPGGDEEFQYAVNELGQDPEDREGWARRQEELAANEGHPGTGMTSEGPVESGAWLIHFTDADPMQIVSSGFKGRELMIISLTKAWKPGTMPGPLAMAYPIDRVRQSNNYGKNAVIFQVTEGLGVYHYGDEEYAVVFDVKGAYNLWPIYGSEYTDSLTVADPKTGDRLVSVEKDSEGIEELLSIVMQGVSPARLAELRQNFLRKLT